MSVVGDSTYNLNHAVLLDRMITRAEKHFAAELQKQHQFYPHASFAKGDKEAPQHSSKAKKLMNIFDGSSILEEVDPNVDILACVAWQ